MDISIRINKKQGIIAIVVGVIGLITLIGFLVSVVSADQEYEGIGMNRAYSIADNIAIAPKNTIFANTLASLGYHSYLQSGSYTVFVPTDSAYANLPEKTRTVLFDPEQTDNLKRVLLYHIVEGRYLSSDIREGMELTSIQGEKLTFRQKDGYWVINDYAYIELSDVVSKNGVIHITTNYLLPPSMVEY